MNAGTAGTNTGTVDALRAFERLAVLLGYPLASLGPGRFQSCGTGRAWRIFEAGYRAGLEAAQRGQALSSAATSADRSS